MTDYYSDFSLEEEKPNFKRGAARRAFLLISSAALFLVFPVAGVLLSIIGFMSVILGVVEYTQKRKIDPIDSKFSQISRKLPVFNLLSDKNTSLRSSGRRGGGREGHSIIAVLLGLGIGLTVLFYFLSGTVVAEYFDYGADEVGFAVGTSNVVDQGVGELRYQGGRLYGGVACLRAGPECIEEYQLNQTNEPDAQSVGNTFELDVRRFDLGAGEAISVDYEDPDQVIPVSFDIYNTRHGVEGINAKNVSYRVSIDDGTQTYCDTGWVPIDGYNVSGEHEGQFVENDLIPGTSASSGFLELEDGYRTIEQGQGLTLQNCQMLQPGARESRNAVLEVKYDYYSQTTLGFEVMGEQTRQAENVQMQERDSITADTPVQTALRVGSPATFNEETNEPEQPISIGATLRTEDRDVSYQVQDLRVNPPSRTCIAGEEGCVDYEDPSDFDQDEAQQCSFVPAEDGSLVLSEDEEDRIISQGEDGIWRSMGNNPSLIGCQLNLDTENHAFTSTGESMAAHAESNYTVRLEENIGQFDVNNNLCTEYNCPLVYPLNDSNLADAMNANPDDPEYSYRDRATCDGTGSTSRCNIISSSTLTPPDVVDEEGELVEMSRGDMALKLTKEYMESPTNPDFYTEYVRSNPEKVLDHLPSPENDDETGIMIYDPDEITEAGRPGKAVNITETGMEIVEVEVENEDEDTECDGWVLPIVGCTYTA